MMPGDFDAYLRSPPLQILEFNVLSSTAEASVIGSEAERKRMLGGGGGYWTPAGDSVEERASNMWSWTVTGFIKKTKVCLIINRWQFNGELKIRRRRR